MRRLLTQASRALLIVLLAAVASALLARYAPGALVDERELNPKLSEDSLRQIRAAQAENQSLGRNFKRYLQAVAKGDLGYSSSNGAPIAALIRDRAPATLREIGFGLAAAWLAGFAFAIPGLRSRGTGLYHAASAIVAGVLLSLPVALIAYLSVAAGAPLALVMALALAPRIFRFIRNFLEHAYSAPDIEAARASGVREWRIFRAHVLPAAAPQLVSLAAISITMAVGAAIPIETICDAPGLGRLAWQAALARDLPLLVNLTMIIALVTTAATGLAEALGGSA